VRSDAENALATASRRHIRWVPALALATALLIAACGGGGSAGTTAPPESIPLTSVAPPARDASDGIGRDTDDPMPGDSGQADAPAPTPAQINASLGNGINLGNALDGPRETTWGPGLEAEYFSLIKQAGFDHIRLPVSWAGYADVNEPYLIPDDDPTIESDEYNSIWERVDWAIDQAEANDLMIVVNMHHYDALHADLDGEIPRFLAMWEQISERLAGAGDHVVLELLNEPNGQFNANPERWNDLFAQTLEIVRVDHPTRTVIVGPVDFNAVTALDSLEVPDDPYLLGTVHVYTPFNFTHQGAVFADPIPPVGTGWGEEYLGLSDAVRNSSWDTDVNAGPNGLVVNYSTQWTGCAVEFDTAFAPTTLSVTASGQTVLRAGCRTADELIEITEITITNAATAFNVDLSACPANTTGIFLQNTLENARSVEVSSFNVCAADGCRDLLSTQRTALEEHFAIAAAWSAETGIPLNLGEFGAFGADGQSPLADRAEWTANVVEIAESHGMSTSYWEFYSGFGAFDVETESWVPELLDALVG